MLKVVAEFSKLFKEIVEYSINEKYMYNDSDLKGEFTSAVRRTSISDKVV